MNEKNRRRMEAFARAVLDGTEEEVRRMLASGADVHTRFRCRNGATTSMIALSLRHRGGDRGSSSILRALLDAKADPCATDSHGRPALHVACEGDRVECARMLLDAGAVMNARGGPADSTALECACFCHARRCVDLLLARGADVNAGDSKGYTPLDAAVISLSYDAAEKMLDVGARVTNRAFADSEFSIRLGRRQRCFVAARTLFGILRFRVRVAATGYRNGYPLPKDLCKRAARFVWHTRRDDDLWGK